jgi:hypothetical protein
MEALGWPRLFVVTAITVFGTTSPLVSGPANVGSPPRSGHWLEAPNTRFEAPRFLSTTRPALGLTERERKSATIASPGADGCDPLHLAAATAVMAYSQSASGC